MSVCPGRIRRVVSIGLFTLPGRNLYIFDDALVLWPIISITYS
jgi:hypothetical protein